MKEERTDKLDWIKIKQSELEKLIVQLHKEGNSPEKIGLILRDKHGIPKASLIGKRVAHILRDAGISLPSEKSIIKKKVEKIESHLAKHKHDYTAKRSLYKKRWLVAKASN